MKNLIFILTVLSIGYAQAQTRPNLMPWPQSIYKSAGEFRIDKSFSIYIDGEDSKRLEDYAARFIQRIGSRTGIFFNNYMPAANQTDHDLHISVKEAGKLQVGTDESYKLIITANSINLNAQTDVGAMRGLETLIQLFSGDNKGYFFPGYIVEDEPRFVWRGLLLDVCRHWLPIDVIKRNIDAMAAVKLNTLHLHLSEDQGFRIESKMFPKLHELGSDGKYFTQKEMKSLVKYAADRGIRVVPEFDIPGHASSWLVGYPELASAPGPYEIARTFGIHYPTLDPTKEYTYEFLDNFLTEMAGLFPDEFFHIGGDENNGKQWDDNPEITKFKNENNLSSNHDLQAYFNLRVSKTLTKLSKRMIGWDEILDEDLPKSIVIQSWRGKQALVEAAELGYDVLLSNGYYIDLSQPASYHYLNDPVPDGNTLSGKARKHVWGGEATMWSELVNAETVDSRIWPRTAAIAERLWSNASVTDLSSMYDRLEKVSVQLEEHGLLHIKNYEMLMRRLVGEENVEILKTLVDVLEPVEGYKRHRSRKYTVYSPLTRVPDIAQPDAIEARKFNLLIDQYLDNGDQSLLSEIKVQLLAWFDNHKKMKSLANQFPGIREVLPLSADLSSIAVLGMQSLSSDKLHDNAWQDKARSILEAAAKPKAECEIRVVEGISKLVDQAR